MANATPEMIGLTVGLLGLVCWFMKWLCNTLSKSIDRNSDMVQLNTAVLSKLLNTVGGMETKANDQLRLSREINDKLLSRPCLMPKE